VSWSKLLVSAWMGCIVVKIISFSMSGMECVVVIIDNFSIYGTCYGQNLQFLACLECVVVKIVSFSMSGMYCIQYSQFPHGWDVLQ
jgi:hypothetical protein